MDREHIKKRLFFWYSFLWIFLIIALYLSYAVYFIDTTSTKSKWVGLFAGAIALLLASLKSLEVLFFRYKDENINKIVKYFSIGNLVFQARKNKVVFSIALIISILLYKPLGLAFIICFICGVVFSLVVNFISDYISSAIAPRISLPQKNHLNSAYKYVMCSGASISMFSSGLCISMIVVLFHIYKDYQTINGFALGAALCALFNSTGSAIVKKASKDAIDFISKFENLNKEDKRNPLLLLNGISKISLNLSSCASDFFTSFAIVLISAMSIGALCLNLMGAFLPIIIAANGLFASIITVLITRISKINNPLKALFKGAFITIVIMVIISYFTVKTWLPDGTCLSYSILIGALFGYISCFINARNIFSKYNPAKNIANTASTGLCPAFIQSIKEGFFAAFLPVLLMALGIILSFILAQGISAPLLGVYGIMLSILALISTMGIMAAVNSFGILAHNINVASKSYEQDINNADDCNLIGSSGYYIISLCKNFINTSAIMCAISGLIAYSNVVELEEIDILNPWVLASLLIGAAIPFLYSSFIMGAASKQAKRLIFEVKKQLGNFPQILRFEMRPDYEKLVDTAALGSSISIVIYSCGIIIILAIIAIFLKQEALAGAIFGAILTTLGLNFTFTNSSLAIKSAKKYLKQEYINSLSSEEYGFLSSIDGIISIFRDLTSYPLNSLIKYIAIMALALVPLFI